MRKIFFLKWETLETFNLKANQILDSKTFLNFTDSFKQMLMCFWIFMDHFLSNMERLLYLSVKSTFWDQF